MKQGPARTKRHQEDTERNTNMEILLSNCVVAKLSKLRRCLQKSHLSLQGLQDVPPPMPQTQEFPTHCSLSVTNDIVPPSLLEEQRSCTESDKHCNAQVRRMCKTNGTQVNYNHHPTNPSLLINSSFSLCRKRDEARLKAAATRQQIQGETKEHFSSSNIFVPLSLASLTEISRSRAMQKQHLLPLSKQKNANQKSETQRQQIAAEFEIKAKKRRTKSSGVKMQVGCRSNISNAQGQSATTSTAKAQQVQQQQHRINGHNNTSAVRGPSKDGGENTSTTRKLIPNACAESTENKQQAHREVFSIYQERNQLVVPAAKLLNGGQNKEEAAMDAPQMLKREPRLDSSHTVQTNTPKTDKQPTTVRSTATTLTTEGVRILIKINNNSIMQENRTVSTNTQQRCSFNTSPPNRNEYKPRQQL